MEIGEVIDKKLGDKEAERLFVKNCIVALQKCIKDDSNKYGKDVLHNTGNRIQKPKEIEKVKFTVDRHNEIESLNFIDGVILTWDIFNKILNKHLRDENGELERDKYGSSYLGIIDDNITDILLNKVLEHGYFKGRVVQLRNIFDEEFSKY